MSDVTIKKAKLVKKGESFEVLYSRVTEGEKLPTLVSETHKTPVHPDMKTAYDNLRIHLAILCGYVLKKEVKDIETPKEELYDSFHVTAISMGKDEDDPGIVLSGHKILSNGKAQILNCPFTRFEEGEKSAYPYVDDLIKKVNRLNLEHHAYLFEGKKADDPQQQLPFEDEKITKMQIDKPSGEGELFKTTLGGSLQPADPGAQERVLNDGHNTTLTTPEPKKNKPLKAAKTKRVKQTAETPSGMEKQPEGIEDNGMQPCGLEDYENNEGAASNEDEEEEDMLDENTVVDNAQQQDE